VPDVRAGKAGIMSTSALIRIRLPLPLLGRLDALAVEIGGVIERRASRASVMRALVRLGLDTALVPELATTINADSVRRGRAKGPRRAS
jgi:hypothetical protein